MLHTPIYPFPVHDIQLYNGSRIAYMDEGAGEETILFIHGLANYAAGWTKNIQGLKERFRCIAIDLPGNGLSENIKGNYTISWFADCIIDFIGRMNLGKVFLAGHSMGGQIALNAVLRAPQCAEKLILCAPAGFETFTEMDKFLYQGSIQYMSWFSNDEYNLQETLRNSFYHFPAGAEQMVKDLVLLMKRQSNSEYKRMIDQCVSSMLNEPVFDRLGEIKQPTLICFGELDGLIPNRILHPVSTRDIARKGARQMPHATLKMIPQCGHFLQWEQAATLNQYIMEWSRQKASV